MMGSWFEILIGLGAILQLVAIVVVIVILLKLFYRFVIAVEKIAEK